MENISPQQLLQIQGGKVSVTNQEYGGRSRRKGPRLISRCSLVLWSREVEGSAVRI
jgi:hypothetical protein